MSGETYSFTARVVGRFKRRISLSPDNPDTFMDYLDRAGLPQSRYRPKGVASSRLAIPS